MKKIIIAVSSLVLLILFLTNAKQNDLNRNTFISAVGVDEGLKKKYMVSLQIINPAGFTKDTSQKSTFFVAKGEGDSFIEAYTNISKGISRFTNYSQVQLVIINEKIAKKHALKQTMENIFRPVRFPYNALLILTKKNKAKDFLHTFSLIEPLTSTEIKNLSTNLQENWGVTRMESPVDFKSEVLKKGKDPVLPVIKLEGDIKKGEEKASLETSEISSKLKFDGLEVFNGYRLVGWIDENQSKIFNLLDNKLYLADFVGKCSKDSTFVFRNYKSHTKLKGKMIKGIPHFSIHTTLRGNLINYLCNDDLQDPTTVRRLAKITEKNLTKRIEQLIHSSIHYHSDFLGLGEIIEINDYKNWQKIEKKWDHLIQKSILDIHVKVNIENYGDIS